MKSRYVTFIIRIRFDESEQSLTGSSSLHGGLHQAGSSLMQPFDTFGRLVDLLRNAIIAIDPRKLDAPEEQTNQD